MDPEGFFADLVRYGRPPGPANLIRPISVYLDQRGTAKRDSISRHLESAWRAAGGGPLSGTDWGSTAERAAWNQRIKRTLVKLRERGSVREAQDGNGERIHGTWEWLGESARGLDHIPRGDAEISIGNGKYLVYGLYDERDKDAAIGKGEDRWLVKIGKTRTASPYHRIQDGAFLPDRLSWGIALWTDEPDVDERLVKGVSERRGRRYDGTGGTEWFETRPEEIRDIYVSITATQ